VALALGTFASCSSEGNPPPAAELFADPELCDVPCEVVLDSGLIDAGGKTLTFTWDLGDGPISGDARLLHTFEEAGTYEVTITVSDGAQSTTDTVSVRAEPQPKASATVDESGGGVTLEAATVTVPADVAPEPVPIELTQLPSMQTDAERLLRVGQFLALGNAYQVSTPLKTATPIDVAVTDLEAVGKAPEDLAWLIRSVAQPVPRPDEPDILSRAPLAGYGLVPVSRVDEDGTAHGEIFGRQRFQLVTLSEPMNIDSFEIEPEPPATESSIANKALTLPLVVIVAFNENPPPGWEAYGAVVKGAVEKSHEVLVTRKAFNGPQGILTVVVGKMPDPRYKGYVTVSNHHMIHLNYTMFDSNKIEKVVAHEFFHLIQNLNSNQASLRGTSRLRDSWFKEGTAEWACDEVFNDSREKVTRTPTSTKPLVSGSGPSQSSRTSSKTPLKTAMR
jgi:PKD repeat protein